MSNSQPNNPLHGITLKALLEELVDHYGWEPLADAVPINCFKNDPSIKSSLKFLRRTPWAREKVEAFYLHRYKKLPKPASRSTRGLENKTAEAIKPTKPTKPAAKPSGSDAWSNWRNKPRD